MEHAQEVLQQGEANGLSGDKVTSLSIELTEKANLENSIEHPSQEDYLNLRNWNTFELNNPDIFPGMYTFWVQNYKLFLR